MFNPGLIQLGRLGGIRIVENPLALEETNEYVKKHKLKKWHVKQFEKRINYKKPKACLFLYHDRIQKKWTKRFGFVMKPCIYQTQYGFVAHPSLIAELKRITGA